MDRDEKARVTRIESGSPAATRRDEGLSWMLGAFGLLVVGLAGGTIFYTWSKDFAWPFPAACFIGYILAFRRGMMLWNPEIDRTWRHYLWIKPVDGGVESRRGIDRGQEPFGSREDVRIVSNSPRPAMRVVR